MNDLETLLRDACKRGLTHMTLAPTPSADGKKVYWRCTATPSTMHKYVSVNHEDPIAAMSAVLKELPKAGRRTAQTKIETEITATVTETARPPGAANLDDNERDQADPAADWLLRP